MSKELLSLADRIKSLRESTGVTQSELAKLFNVSTDCLLGMENTSTISIVGLSEKQVTVLLETIDCFKNVHK